MKREKAQILEGFVSIVGNAVLFGAKFWVGVTTGSIALVADAWHTLSDSLTSIFVVVAAKLASKKPDKEHPFGHGRWELIAAIMIAFLLIFIGYEFLTSSIERFQNQDGVVYGTLALVITVISILGKEAMAQFAFHLGRKHDNPVISADGWHHRTDSLSSVVVLIGIIIVRFFPDFWWMDSVLGMFCALAIFYAAFEIMKVAIKRILGEQPSAEFLEKLNVEVNKVYGSDLKMHHVHLHNYITQKELTLHIRLQKDMTIEEGHVIASKIEQAVKDNFDMIATIHVEPLK